MSYYFTDNLKKQIGARIKKERRAQNLQQVEVATEAGVNPSYYSKIERGEVNPSLEKFYRIVKALKVKSSDLLPF